MTTLTQDAAPALSTHHGGLVAEQYYALVQMFRSSGDPSAPASMAGVTACEQGVGVSTVAANLALAAAQSGDRPVLLLDMSNACPPARPGAPRLTSSSLPGELVRPSSVPNLSLLALNEHPDARALRVDGARIYNLLRSLESDFGFIVVDLPATDSPACVAIAGLLDGILLVMRAEHTKSEAAMRAKQRLVQSNAKLLGVIFNQDRQHIPRWLDARL